MCDKDKLWCSLPEPVLLYILSLLDIPSQAACGLVCTLWAAVFRATYLWKQNLQRDFLLDPNTPLPQGVSSKSKYKQLYYEAPVLESQVLTGGRDEVRHVGFSHDGSMFVTLCESGQFIVWTSSFPSTCIHSGHCWWKYCENSQFSPDDRFLLVNGNGLGRDCAVFDVNNNFAKIRKAPAIYQPIGFGAWYDNTYFVVSSGAHQSGGQSPVNVFKIENCCITFVRCVFNRVVNGVGSMLVANVPHVSGDPDGNKCIIFKSLNMQFDNSVINIKYLDRAMEKYHNVEPSCAVDAALSFKSDVTSFNISPDHRYLYVNCRPYILSNQTLLTPRDCEIQVVELATMQKVNKTLMSHKAFSPSWNLLPLHVSVSCDYVVSGSEDNQGYLWDRHYGSCIYRYPHRHLDCHRVTCVAFNPIDQGMLVTVSDDGSAKVWRSRKDMKEVHYAVSAARPPSPTLHNVGATTSF